MLSLMDEIKNPSSLPLQFWIATGARPSSRPSTGGGRGSRGEGGVVVVEEVDVECGDPFPRPSRGNRESEEEVGEDGRTAESAPLLW